MNTKNKSYNRCTKCYKYIVKGEVISGQKTEIRKGFLEEEVFQINLRRQLELVGRNRKYREQSKIQYSFHNIICETEH